MPGTSEARICDLCQKCCYWGAGSKPGPLQGLISEHDDDPVERIYQRADGSVMSSDCGYTAARRQRLRARWCRRWLGALFTVSALGSGLVAFEQRSLRQSLRRTTERRTACKTSCVGCCDVDGTCLQEEAQSRLARYGVEGNQCITCGPRERPFSCNHHTGCVGHLDGAQCTTDAM